jgi:hypothetical protein
MKVNYRQENTCYKQTPYLSWSEARRTCWMWGGELAFPLTGAKYCSDTGIYREQTEEVSLVRIDCSILMCKLGPLCTDNSFALYISW